MSPSSTSASDRFEPDAPEPDLTAPYAPGPEPTPAERRRRRAGIVGSVAIALALLVMAELLVRAMPSLPAPLRWNDNETDLKVTRLTRLGAGGRRLPVVYIGSSIMDAAVEPATVAAAWPAGTGGYNAGVEGMDGRSIGAWAESVVRPLARPRLVVIGLSPRELNDNGAHQASFDSSFFDSPGWRRASGAPSIPDRVTDLVARHSVLIESRTRLTDPYNTLVFWRRGRAGPWVSPNESSGRVTDFDVTGYAPPDPSANDGVFNDFHVGGGQYRALHDAIVALHRHGIAVVVVQTARIEEDLRQLLSPSRIATADDAIARLAASTCSPLIDLRDATADRARFEDVVHTNKSGAELESTLLGQRLAALGAGALTGTGC